VLLLFGKQKEADKYDYLVCFFVHFFACPKKRTKEKTANHLVRLKADCPVFLEMTGSLKTRCAQTSQTPVSVISVVLGGVKWQKHEKRLLFVSFTNPFIAF